MVDQQAFKYDFFLTNHIRPIFNRHITFDMVVVQQGKMTDLFFGGLSEVFSKCFTIVCI